MEAVVERSNKRRAYERVVRNKGAAGVDDGVVRLHLVGGLELWRLSGEAGGDEAGTSLAMDYFNADSRADLVVSAPGNDHGYRECGRGLHSRQPVSLAGRRCQRDVRQPYRTRARRHPAEVVETRRRLGTSRGRAKAQGRRLQRRRSSQRLRSSVATMRRPRHRLRTGYTFPRHSTGPRTWLSPGRGISTATASMTSCEPVRNFVCVSHTMNYSIGEWDGRLPL